MHTGIIMCHYQQTNTLVDHFYYMIFSIRNKMFIEV